MAVIRRKPAIKTDGAKVPSWRKLIGTGEVKNNISEEQEEKSLNKGNSQEETLTTENANQENEERSTDTTEKINYNYDLHMFQPSTSKSIKRGNMIAGAISVINSNSGKRVTLSKDLMAKLTNPIKVVMSFTEDKIAIGERLPNNDNYLSIIVRGAKGNIYSAGLVSEITKKYGLDFSNKTSITFSEVEYIQNDAYMIAIINIKSLIKGGSLDGQV